MNEWVKIKYVVRDWHARMSRDIIDAVKREAVKQARTTDKRGFKNDLIRLAWLVEDAVLKREDAFINAGGMTEVDFNTHFALLTKMIIQEIIDEHHAPMLLRRRRRFNQLNLRPEVRKAKPRRRGMRR